MLQTSQVCVNIFSASATRQLSGGCRRDIEQRFQSCFLTLWTCEESGPVRCFVGIIRLTAVQSDYVMSLVTHVMSLSRFVDDSNRRRSHGKLSFRTPESRGVIITFWKAHGMLSRPLSIFPMSGDILGDWHEWTPMAWPSLEKWWFNGLRWRKPWWFAPPNIFVVFCSSVFFNCLYLKLSTPVWIWQFDWAPWFSKPFNHWSKGYPSSRMSRSWRSTPLAPSTCVGPLFQPWKNRPSVAWWDLELERIGWCWKAINLPGKWRSRFLTF